MEPGRIRRADTEEFMRGEFGGWKYIAEMGDMGFTALVAKVNGTHPSKKMEDATRVYYVIEGRGTFTVDDIVYDAVIGDMFIIPPGSSYEYQGRMDMFEFNVAAKPGSGERDEPSLDELRAALLDKKG